MAVSHCKEWGNDPVEEEQYSAHPLVHLGKIINLSQPYLDCAGFKGNPGPDCAFAAMKSLGESWRHSISEPCSSRLWQQLQAGQRAYGGTQVSASWCLPQLCKA